VSFSFYLGAIPWSDFLALTINERIRISNKLDEILAEGGESPLSRNHR